MTASRENTGVIGRPSIYPGKRRDRPVQVALTDEGLDCLDKGIARTGYSKANYIEKLLRDEEARQGRRFERRKLRRKARREAEATTATV